MTLLEPHIREGRLTLHLRAKACGRRDGRMIASSP